MSQVLALASSPRKGGNSELLLDACLEPVARAGILFEKIRVCDLDISPCLNCGGCMEEGECVVDDDMQMLFDKFAASPTLLVSAPVFFMGLPAQLKAVIDRCQAVWVRKYLLRRRMPDADSRRAFFIQVGGMKKDKIFAGGLATIEPFFATLDYKFSGRLLLADIDARGAVSDHPSALEGARKLGARIVSGA